MNSNKSPLLSSLTLVLAAIGLLTGCEVIRVVPSTNDASAWRQPWVEQERLDHERYVRWAADQACDPLSWPIADTSARHPECSCSCDPAKSPAGACSCVARAD